MENEGRRKAYAGDITYVTNQEIGFDFLRDNLVYSKADRVLRALHPLHFGIVDEIDSILIDESRTPLIIAEPVKEEAKFFMMCLPKSPINWPKGRTMPWIIAISS